VVQVAEAPEAPEHSHSERSLGSSSSAKWIAAGAACVVGIGLGALGNTLVTPGHSLAVPTGIVAAIGGGLLLVAWVVCCFRARRQAGWIFAVGIAVVTVLACLWTFEFALPASIEWSNATAQAQAALEAAQHAPAPVHGHVSRYPCSVHTTGSVGPLAAPYQRCTIWSPEGHIVSFVASGPGGSGGLVYTDRPSVSFPDQCARHMVGKWWLVAPLTDSNGDPGTCYFGYGYHGGP
jgi:hypothetical protein